MASKPLSPPLPFPFPRKKERKKERKLKKEKIITREGRGSHGGVDRADEGVRVRGPGAGGLRVPQLLDGHPGRQGPQEVQGVLPRPVRRGVGEQGCQALQLRPEGAPELARDDADILCHAAARRPAASGHRRCARGALHRREVLLLQGLRHWRPGEPSQDWVCFFLAISTLLLSPMLSDWCLRLVIMTCWHTNFGGC